MEGKADGLPNFASRRMFLCVRPTEFGFRVQGQKGRRVIRRFSLSALLAQTSESIGDKAALWWSVAEGKGIVSRKY